jgi:hypothetical protein
MGNFSPESSMRMDGAGAALVAENATQANVSCYDEIGMKHPLCQAYHL